MELRGHALCDRIMICHAKVQMDMMNVYEYDAGWSDA